MGLQSILCKFMNIHAMLIMFFYYWWARNTHTHTHSKAVDKVFACINWKVCEKKNGKPEKFQRLGNLKFAKTWKTVKMGNLKSRQA